MTAECHEVGLTFVEAVGVETLLHGLFDVPPVTRDLGNSGSSDQAALRPRLSPSDGFVIGVEEEAVTRVEDGIVRVAAEDELLEEPAGVASMPLGRARVRHRLRRLVFG